MLHSKCKFLNKRQYNMKNIRSTSFFYQRIQVRVTKNRQKYERSFKSTPCAVFTVRNGPREEDMRAIYDLIQYPTDNDDVTIARLLVTSHGRYVTRDQTVEMSRMIMVLLYITLCVTLFLVTQHAVVYSILSRIFYYSSDPFATNVILTNVEYLRFAIPIVTLCILPLVYVPEFYFSKR